MINMGVLKKKNDIYIIMFKKRNKITLYSVKHKRTRLYSSRQIEYILYCFHCRWFSTLIMLIHHLQVNSQIILSVISRKKYWFFFQSFTDLANKPQIVDLLVEEGQRLKVVYGSNSGFHAIDVDTTSLYDLYIPSHVSYLTALISLYMSIFLKLYQIFSFIITCKSYLAKNDWSLSLAASVICQ
jgi:hypothetical protein